MILCFVRNDEIKLFNQSIIGGLIFNMRTKSSEAIPKNVRNDEIKLFNQSIIGGLIINMRTKSSKAIPKNKKLIKSPLRREYRSRPQWASYQLRKIAVYACAGNAGNVCPTTDFKGKMLVSDPGMHHNTCVTHVP